MYFAAFVHTNCTPATDILLKKGEAVVGWHVIITIIITITLQ